MFCPLQKDPLSFLENIFLPFCVCFLKIFSFSVMETTTIQATSKILYLTRTIRIKEMFLLKFDLFIEYFLRFQSTSLRTEFETNLVMIVGIKK